MYGIIFTWYVHTHSSILNLDLCTHYTQQHCCNVLLIVVFIYPAWYIIPGNTYVEYIHMIWYTHVYGCAHVSHVRFRRALVFVCFIPGTNPARVGSGSIKTCLKKLNTDRWKNMPRLYPKGQWSKTRGTPQHNPSTHEALSFANKRTTTAASSRKKQYQSVVPLYYMYEYHTATAVVVST